MDTSIGMPAANLLTRKDVMRVTTLVGGVAGGIYADDQEPMHPLAAALYQRRMMAQ